MTITEALAEIKTIQKRITKKREFVLQYLVRHNTQRDPLENSGGSITAIKETRQSIEDLQKRIVLLRGQINLANTQTFLTVESTVRSLADWIVWKREVAPHVESALRELSLGIKTVRQKARKEGFGVAKTEATSEDNDVIINVDERELADQIEQHEKILGMLDGQLSLKNATVSISV